MVQNDSGGQSAFNFAVAYLTQIDKTLSICKHAQLSTNKTLWLSALHTLHTELSLRTTNGEDEEIFEMFSEINTLINDDSTNTSILTKLMKLDMHLRKIIQSKGMGLPSKDDPRWAVMKR
jgi:abortive infection bacteriophage resistance protein